MPKKILFLFTYDVSLKIWDENGILSRESANIIELAKKGHEITLLTYGASEDLGYFKEFSNINVIPFFSIVSKRFGFLKSFFAFFFLRDSLPKQDLIITNQMKGSWAAYFFCFFSGSRLITRCGFQQLWNHYREATGFKNKYFKSIFYYLIEAFSFSLSEKIIFTSNSSIEYSQKKYPWLSSQKFYLIRNYIDTSLFRPTQTEKVNEILFVGRLNKVKNLKFLLQNLGENQKLNIVGHGELEKDIKENIGHHNFLGKVDNDELPSLYNKYQYSILASEFENNPKSLMEAMACGSVVLGHNTFGINELIQHKVNGLLFNKSNFKDVINTAFNLKKEDIESYQNSARDFALKNYSKSETLDKYINLVES